MAAPFLKLKPLNGTASQEIDITTFIQEDGLQIEHEDLDADGSGRNPDTGEMVRTRIAEKHTITVKLRRINQSDINEIFEILFPVGPNSTVKNSNPYFKATFMHPCRNGSQTFDMYCSSFNFGAQRYDRQTDTTYYSGSTFKIIQK